MHDMDASIARGQLCRYLLCGLDPPIPSHPYTVHNTLNVHIVHTYRAADTVQAPHPSLMCEGWGSRQALYCNHDTELYFSTTCTQHYTALQWDHDTAPTIQKKTGKWPTVKYSYTQSHLTSCSIILTGALTSPSHIPPPSM